MTKNMFLDLWREIRRSANRFLSIMIIVIIGVAVFAGLRSAPLDMTYTIDSYFDEYNTMDFRIISSLGLTDDDISRLEALDIVEDVQPGYFVDAQTSYYGIELILRINSLPDGYEDGEYINEMKLVRGRMPEQAGEIVVESSEMYDYGFEVGEQLTFYLNDGDITEDGLAMETFTIVGLVEMPLYLSPDKETSTIDGKAYDLFSYTVEDSFNVEGYYTEANVTIKGAKELNSFDSEYKKLITNAYSEIKNVGTDRSSERAEELRDEAEKQLAEGQAEYEAAKSDFYAQVDDAEQQLKDGYAELKAAEAQLDDLAEFSTTINEAYNEQIASNSETITSAKEQLAAATEQYNAITEQYNLLKSSSSEYVTMLGQLETFIGELKDQITELSGQEGTETSVSLLSETLTYVTERYNSISELNTTITSTMSTVDEAMVETQAQLQELNEMVNEGESALNEARADQQAQMNELYYQQSSGQAQVTEGWEEYNEGQEELDTQKADGEAQLEEASEQLIEARIEIEKLDSAEWYILDRLSNYGYASYDSTVTSMKALGEVIPFFFLLVAILVCVTTMTRMVGEQRTVIGTYKALGYSDSAITKKYVIYVLIASVLGGAIGVFGGIMIFPYAMYTAWDALYVQPELMKELHWGVIGFSLIVTILVMMLTALITTKRELNDVPAALMRPKAPKHGKATFLEKTALWKKFSFSQKVTARNILRYKKRLLMTVIGIMGCTSLLLAALGMNDTINSIVGNQYGKVFSYDMEITTISERTADKLVSELTEDGYMAKIMATDSVTISANDKSETVTLYVSDDYSDISNYILLQERVSHKKLVPQDEGVIITEKLASNLNVKVGDYVEVMNQDMITKAVPVTGITENYVFHFVYMTETCYKTCYKSSLETDTVFLDMTKDKGSQTQEDLYEELCKRVTVASVQEYTSVADDFQDQLDPIKSIVYIIILCAALLAFVVLYNLTNINISERIREIATIKVLGFKGQEVAMYIYRENAVMTFIGAIVGLAGGIGLHRLIIKAIEQSYLMYGYVIEWQSYIIAVLLTFVFSTLVMLVMYRRLVNIPMIESLKSIE